MVAQDSLSAQVAVLGSLLIEPRLVGEALERVRPEDFTTPRCRMVFETIRSLFAQGRPTDPVTVRDALGGRPEEGWSQYLMELMEVTPTAANVWEYAALMREQARMAQTSALAGQLQAAAVSGDKEAVQALLGQLNGLQVERRGVQRMDMAQMLLSFTERHSGEPHQYMTWGLPKVDKALFVDMGDFVVLGGYPSAGKTALAVAFAFHQARDRRVGFYSLETNRYKLADRLISNLAGIEMETIKGSRLTDEDWAQVAKQSDRIRARQLELIEASCMTVQDIQADAMAHRYEVVYVDYLQIVEPETRRANRTEQVSAISRGLQQLAHGSGRLVVALAQLTRAEYTSKHEQVEPTMSDLRESGQIEQDADAILLLYLERPNQPDTSRRALKVGKNKEGVRMKTYLVFDGQYQRFRESALDEPAPAPKGDAARRSKSDQQTYINLPDSYPVPFSS